MSAISIRLSGIFHFIPVTFFAAAIFFSLSPFVLFAQQEQYVRYRNINGIRYVYLSDLAKFYNMELSFKNDGCEIRSRDVYFFFRYEKRSGYFNGVSVNYLYAPVSISNTPFVSEVDYKKIIAPLLRPDFIIPKKTIRHIVIDPGHGGKDNGAETKYREKDINLAIAFKLKDELRKKGFIVSMTRDKDIFLELEQRTAIAEKLKADLFISIHSNAASNRYIRGIETYCLTPEGTPSTGEKRSSGSKQKGNAFDNQNIYLAYLVQRCLIGNTAAIDRGVKHSRFVVLKTAPCPAVLVECGFLTNEWEMKNLAWNKYQQAIAESIAQAISYYTRTLR